MSDGAFPDRLTQLRSRWESDPSSRIFLQLAEEYRHQGRVREALAVLEKGLREHPGYLSALVAKGRCLLELGEPDQARAVLERVVKQDATQLVANKLLVRAYIETSEPEKARERLDLYTLLNDSDSEIEELRRRLRAMDQPPQAVNSRAPEAPGSPFDDIFNLDAPAPRPASPAARPDEPFADLFTPPPAVAPAAVAPVAPVAVVADTAAEEPEPDDVLFPGLSSGDSRRRYLAGLAAEGLFAELAPEPAASMQAAPAPAPFVAEAFVEPFPVEEAPAPATVAGFSWQREEEVVVAPEPEPLATATLGELYLRQGHAAEAERIFHEVLSREPENASALEGLAKLSGPAAEEAAEARPLTGSDLLAGHQPGVRPGEGESNARKAFALRSYLERIRRGAQRNVS
jgi:tetratricopeptide (TPR) repeat protein